MFSHDGRLLASGGIDDRVVFWDVATREELGYFPTSQFEQVYGIAFSPDDQRVATATSRGDVLIWDNSDDIRQVQTSFHGAHRAEINDVVASRNGTTVVAKDDAGSIVVWDAATREPVNESLVPADETKARGRWPSAPMAGCSPWPASGSPCETSPRVDRLVPWARPTPTRGPHSVQTAASWPPPMAAPSCCWDVSTRSEKGRLPPADSAVVDLFYTADGTRLIGGTDTEQIVLWDLPTGQSRVVVRDDDGYYSMAVSPNGTVVATGGNVTQSDVTLWDVATGRPLASLSGHADIVSDLAFSPTGAELVSVGHDGALFLWDVASRQRIGPPLRGHRKSLTVDLPALIYGVAYGGADAVYSVGTDGRVVSWDFRLSDWTDWACQLAARNLSQAEWDRYLPGQDYHRTCAGLPSGRGAPPDAPS